MRRMIGSLMVDARGCVGHTVWMYAVWCIEIWGPMYMDRRIDVMICSLEMHLDRSPLPLFEECSC